MSDLFSKSKSWTLVSFLLTLPPFLPALHYASSSACSLPGLVYLKLKCKGKIVLSFLINADQRNDTVIKQPFKGHHDKSGSSRGMNA